MTLTQFHLAQAADAAREIDAALAENQALGSGNESLPARLRHAEETLLPVLARHRAFFAEVAPSVADGAALGARLLFAHYEWDERKVAAIVEDLSVIQALRRAPDVVATCFQQGSAYAESAALAMLNTFEWCAPRVARAENQFFGKLEAALERAEANLALPS